MLGHGLAPGSLGLGLGLGADRHVSERHPVPLAEFAHRLVVRDHERNVGAQAARGPAVEQVGEAMVELGNGDENPRSLAKIPQTCAPLETTGKRGERLAQRGLVAGVLKRQVDTDEEFPGIRVTE